MTVISIPSCIASLILLSIRFGRIRLSTNKYNNIPIKFVWMRGHAFTILMSLSTARPVNNSIGVNPATIAAYPCKELSLKNAHTPSQGTSTVTII